MKVTDAADLTANLMAAGSVLAVSGIAVLALRHTMKPCECCGPPDQFEPDDNDFEDDEGEIQPEDPDRLRDQVGAV